MWKRDCILAELKMEQINLQSFYYMWAAPRGRVFTSEVNYHGFMEMSASVHLKTSLIIKFWCRTVATLIFS